jgi:hypothetical protein
MSVMTNAICPIMGRTYMSSHTCTSASVYINHCVSAFLINTTYRLILIERISDASLNSSIYQVNYLIVHDAMRSNQVLRYCIIDHRPLSMSKWSDHQSNVYLLICQQIALKCIQVDKALVHRCLCLESDIRLRFRRNQLITATRAHVDRQPIY